MILSSCATAYHKPIAQFQVPEIPKRPKLNIEKMTHPKTGKSGAWWSLEDLGAELNFTDALEGAARKGVENTKAANELLK